MTALRVDATSAATRTTSAQGECSIKRQHEWSDFCLMLRSPRLALLSLFFSNSTQPLRAVEASIIALCILLTAHALALCGKVARGQPSCLACTTSRCCVLAGATGLVLLTGLAAESVLTWTQ